MKKSVLLVHLILCILSITSFVAEAQIPSYVPSNGLVGWWPFNGNANDESGNGNNGTVNGATLTSDRFGNAGKAYSFNGVQQNILLNNMINISNSFSLSYWVNIPANGGGCVVVQNKPISPYYTLFQAQNIQNINNSKSISSLYYTNSSNCLTGQGQQLWDTSNAFINQWHNYTFTVDGLGTCNLYIDGQFTSTYNGTQFTMCNTNSGVTLRIGGEWVSNDPQWFLGKIDDIGIWNRALTQQEITALYNAQPCTPQIVYIHDTLYQAPPCLPNYVPTNGLVGWWPFCGNANDESGNGNNGTVNGATLTTDRFGNAGKAYSFDGVSFIEVQNSSNLNFGINNSFTISTWLNDTSFYSAWNVFMAHACTDAQNLAGATGGFQFGISNSNYQFELGQTSQQLFTGGQVILNNWHNIIVVANRIIDTAFIYVDNLLIGKKGIPTTYSYSPSCNSNILFGAERNNWTSYFFNGQLDDIGIWNRALTQQEITALYTGSPCTQMITLYDTIHTYDTITTLVHTYDTIPVYDTIHIAVTDTLIINANLTGVNPPNNYNTVKVYPNPAKDYLILNFGSNWSSMSGYQVTITNITGQQVYNGNVINQVINLSLNSWGGYGTYTLTIRDTQGNLKEIKKIVLQ